MFIDIHGRPALSWMETKRGGNVVMVGDMDGEGRLHLKHVKLVFLGCGAADYILFANTIRY